MKHSLASLLPVVLIGLTAAVRAQEPGSVRLDIRVIDNRGRGLAGLPVALRERATATELTARTDARGGAAFHLSTGDEWLVYVEGRRHGRDVITVREGVTAEQSLLITHDPAYDDRIARQSFRRDTLTVTDMRGMAVPARSLPGHTLLEVLVRNGDDVGQPGLKVRVVDLSASRAWLGMSDAAGRVMFHLPVGRAYDIDVEDQLNAAWFDPGSMGEGLSMTGLLALTYDRYRVREQRRGDTTRQWVAPGEPMRHSKALLRLHVERDGAPAAGEKVYVNDAGSSQVWESVTDAAGHTAFVLPFGHRYLVHFRFQRDVEAVDFIAARKQAEAELSLEYLPDPAMEHPERYVPQQWRTGLWPFDRYRRIPYPDASAPGGAMLTVRGAGPLRAGHLSGILQAGLRIPAIAESSVGPLNLGLVLDISGSMASDDNIERMKAGVVRLLEGLRPDDIVSITLFDDKPELLVPARRLGSDRRAITALVRSLGPRGGTLVSAALRIAAQQVRSRQAGGGSPFLVLVTDGYVSDDPDSVVHLLRTWLPGLPCITVGTGAGCHAGFLERVAALSGRQPVVVTGDPPGVQLSRKVFAKVEPVASDMRIRYMLPPGLTVVGRHGGRYDTLTRTVVLSAASAYAEEEFTSLLGLARAPGYRGGRVGVVASWYDHRLRRRDSVLRWVDPFAPAAPDLTADVRRLYAMAGGMASLERMVQAGLRRDFDPAIASLQDGLKTIDALQPAGAVRDAEVVGLRAILEECLSIMREIRRKSLLPH